MRIKAITKAQTFVTNMANGASAKIATIEPDEPVTIIRMSKDGGNSYYFIEEYRGYVKKEYVKLLRDEDFYYSSKLLYNKKNRAKGKLYAAKKYTTSSAAAASYSSSVVPNYSTVTSIDNNTSLATANEGGYYTSDRATNTSYSSQAIVQPYTTSSLNAANANATYTTSLKSYSTSSMTTIGTETSTVVPAYDNKTLTAAVNNANAYKTSASVKGLSVIDAASYSTEQDKIAAAKSARIVSTNKALASVGIGFLSNTGLGKSAVGKTGLSMLSSYATTGSWDAANKMNLGGIFGDSALGSVFNGATISNLSDGSFFGNIAENGISGLLSSSFDTNIKKMLQSYITTLLQKLDYVVGFNLSGILLNWLSGYTSNKTSSMYVELSQVYKPSDVYEEYSALDEQIKKYFQYKGCNYETIVRTGQFQRWEQDAYYTTGTMDSSNNSDDVEIFREMNNSTYTEFEDSLKIIRNTVNLEIERTDWFYNFNRYRLIHPDSVLGNTKGYVFFTRPDLNIGDTDLMTSDVGALFFNMLSQHSGIVSELSSSMSGNHKFMPLLCNRCTGIELADENLETKEVNETLTGFKLNYALNLLKSKSANTVSTSFIDDEQLSVYLMFKLWCEYISGVSRGVISPKAEYIHQKQLDYAISIYYFLCNQDGESIIFWTKYTGCIPTVIPSSNFSDSIDSPIKIPKYSIIWQYAFKKDYDPFSLAEFNYLTGDDFQYDNIYNSDTGRSALTIAGPPFVDTNTGGALFKLRFRPKPE